MLTVEQIYDAAFDPRLFDRLLDQLCAAFGASKAFIGWNDIDREANFHAQAGGDPLWEQRYAEHYWQHDILRPRLYAFAEGACVAVRDVLTEPEVRDSLFYREFLAPQQVVDNLAVNLIKRPTMNAHMALIRSGDAAPFDASDIARLQDLVPHLRRAIIIQSRLVDAANIAGAHRQIAMGARAHVLLLSDRLRLLDVDAQMAGLLGARLGDDVTTLAIGRAVRACLDGADAVTLSVVGPDEEPVTLLCEVQALRRDGFADLTSAPGAAFAVHLSIVDAPLAISFGAMASHYGLTPTEARVLEDAVEQGEARTTGVRLGMGRATVRTHLHRIYDKTGTGGFGELLRLAHRFASAQQAERG